ncbi:MAG TPA: VOC family protein [Thermoanaerobaculia bacterium]|nr:VOC family protein [Thermoanaerobaculia bacterium]
MRATFGHVNLIARDWRRLSRFYQDVFGCTPVPPDRDYRGDDVDRATALRDAHITGEHLRLPGFGDNGPTLEIYSYDEFAPAVERAINRPGFGHLAFAVDDVTSALGEFRAEGGTTLGEVVTLTTKAGTKVTFVYARDPEGNIIELQSWSR